MTSAELEKLCVRMVNQYDVTRPAAIEILMRVNTYHLPRMSEDELIEIAMTVYLYDHGRSQLQLRLKKNGQQKMEMGPPRFAQFTLLLIPKRSREHLIGDLEEEFRTIVLPQYGRFLARCWYFEQVAIAIGCYAWPTIKKILGLSFILKLIGR
jgi:hypothetical protein